MNLWIFTLLIPFALGFIYHIEPDIYSKIMENTHKMPYLSLIALIAVILVIKKIYRKTRTSKNTEKNKLNRKSIIVTLGLIILGVLVVFYIIKDTELLSRSLMILSITFRKDGYIYINLYSNMLLLIPLTIYFLIKNIKKDYFIQLLLVLCILFIEILLIAYKYEKISIYYLSKNYFALWIILFYCNYRALIILSENKKVLPRFLIGLYAGLMVIYTSFSNVKMIDDALTNEDENIMAVMEIFGSNKTLLIEEKEKLNQKEIEILMYARENLNYNSKIEVVTEGIPYYWSYVMLRYINYEPILDMTNQGQRKLNLKSHYLYNKIENVDYMIYFNRSQRYSELKNRLFTNAEIIYENEAGGILKYNRK